MLFNLFFSLISLFLSLLGCVILGFVYIPSNGIKAPFQLLMTVSESLSSIKLFISNFTLDNILSLINLEFDIFI